MPARFKGILCALSLMVLLGLTAANAYAWGLDDVAALADQAWAFAAVSPSKAMKERAQTVPLKRAGVADENGIPNDCMRSIGQTLCQS